MKKLVQQFLWTATLICAQFTSQASVVNVSGDITTNTTWTKNNQYLLNGFVYVKNNATLTIEPGTVIKGDKASKGTLIITRGAKINAAGTPTEPIVFTSNQPAGQRSLGDWGGIIILGKARQNFFDTVSTNPIVLQPRDGVIEGGVDNANGDGRFGGTDDADNSGVMTYVRIEFPGIAFQPNNEINGLTCASVGTGTTLHHIQVSHSGDDSYEFFGGTVNAHHLIAFRGVDDDFDTDNGYRGKLQFGVCYRDAAISDNAVSNGASNGFESDNDVAGSSNAPITGAVFSNFTIIGPRENASTNLTGQVFRRAVHIRRNSAQSIYNSVFLGFPTGLFIDGSASQANATSGNLEFKYNSFYGCPKMERAYDSAFVNAAANNIIWGANTSDAKLTAPYNTTLPNAVPVSGSPVLSGADFSSAKLSSGFTTVTYRGAFGAGDTWAIAPWTNYDAQNTPYTAPSAVEEIGNIDYVAILPNPATDNTSLLVKLNEISAVQVTVMDLRGQIVSQEQHEMNSTTSNLKITTANYASGVYLVEVKTKSSTKVVKLVVEK